MAAIVDDFSSRREFDASESTFEGDTEFELLLMRELPGVFVNAFAGLTLTLVGSGFDSLPPEHPTSESAKTTPLTKMIADFLIQFPAQLKKHGISKIPNYDIRCNQRSRGCRRIDVCHSAGRFSATKQLYGLINFYICTNLRKRHFSSAQKLRQSVAYFLRRALHPKQLMSDSRSRCTIRCAALMLRWR
ncbi:MAG: hypothetical protein IPN69_13320 [Acidobacteria bacterium]|nr:hypothetical protein [Acidobacteriota bacterium]